MIQIFGQDYKIVKLPHYTKSREQQTNKQNSMKQMNKKEFKEFTDKLFPVMSP
jgi:hypothetical protein